MSRVDIRRCQHCSPSEAHVAAGAALPVDYEFNRPFREVTCHASARGCAKVPEPCPSWSAQATCDYYAPDPGTCIARFGIGEHVAEIWHAHSLNEPRLVITLDGELIFSPWNTTGLFYGLTDLEAAATLAKTLATTALLEFDLGTPESLPPNATTTNTTRYFEELVK